MYMLSLNCRLNHDGILNKTCGIKPIQLTVYETNYSTSILFKQTSQHQLQPHINLTI